MDNKLLLGIEDVIAATGIGRTKIYEYFKTGELPAVKLGKRTLVKTEDLKAFVDGLVRKSAA